jgi:hypothetical protein
MSLMQHSQTSSLTSPLKTDKNLLEGIVPLSLALAMVCVVLLFFRNAGYCLNYNESHNLIYAASHTSAQLLRIDDMHPPGFYLFMHFWQKVAQKNEYLLRLPSLIFSLLSIPLLYVTGKRMFGKNAAVIGAMLLAVTPLNVEAATSARPYALMMLVFLGSLFSFLSVLEQNKLIHHAINSVSIFVALSLHYYTIFIPFYQIIFLLLNFGSYRQIIKKLIPFQAVVAVAYLPLAYIAVTYQLRLVNPIGGAGILTFANFTKLLYAISPFAHQYAYAASPAVVTIASLFLALILLGTYPPAKNLLSIIIVAAPIIIVAAVSNLAAFKFYQAYHFTFLLPAFVLLAANGLSRFGRIGYATAFFVFLTALAMPIKQPNPDWRSCAGYLQSNADGRDKVIVCPELNDGLFYYWPAAPIIPIGFVKPGMHEPRRIWLVLVYENVYYNETAKNNLLMWFRYLGYRDEPIDARVNDTKFILLSR